MVRAPHPNNHHPNDNHGHNKLEENVFSPGNLGSCSKLAGADFSEPILDAIERKVAIASQYAQTFDNRHLAVL